MQTQYDKRLKTLKTDLQALRNDLGSLMDLVKTDVKDEVQDRKQSLREQGTYRLGQIRHASDSLRRQGQRAAQGVRDEVAEKPLVSLAAALGAGIILGRIVGRGRRS